MGLTWLSLEWRNAISSLEDLGDQENIWFSREAGASVRETETENNIVLQSHEHVTPKDVTLMQ